MSIIATKLTLDIKSYWRAGSGDSGGSYADLLVIKKKGLPYLPGKQLRGLLKKAFVTASAANWFDQSYNNKLVDLLFGQEGAQGQGLLITPSATLSPAEKNWLSAERKRVEKLFHTLDTQAVDYESGTTKIGSLRTMEVTIPLKLSTTVSLRQDAEHNFTKSDLQQWLNDCCCLINVVGADKNRGFGQVVIKVAELIT